MIAPMDAVRKATARAELALIGLSVKVAPPDVGAPKSAAAGALTEARELLAPFALRPFVARLAAHLRAHLEGELAEEFLQTLLTAMRIVLIVDRRFRREIDGFDARIEFCTHDGTVEVAAEFADGCMRVWEGRHDSPDLTVWFADGAALMRYLMQPDQDVLGSMLRHEVKPDGNLNVLSRFAYLARRLQSRFQLS